MANTRSAVGEVDPVMADHDYRENLRTLKYTLPEPPHLSVGIKQLFSRLFAYEKDRYTIEELAQDPWLTEGHH